MLFGIPPLKQYTRNANAHSLSGPAQSTFRPTPQSIPPPNADLTLNIPDNLPTNAHPLASLYLLVSCVAEQSN